jgi:hypothetical protein
MGKNRTKGLGTVRILLKVVFLFVFQFSLSIAAFAQDPNPNFNKELDQETPQEQKQEAEKPDSKASAGDLAKATQNPVASLVSVPLQNLTDFNIGPFSRDRNTVIQAQPVIPISLGQNWNLSSANSFGQRARHRKIQHRSRDRRVGPAWQMDARRVGQQSLVRRRLGWSPRLNSMTFQYFINYNLKKGYYITIQPIISANWNAPSGNVWLVPFGGGIGRIMRLGFQPVNVSVQVYGNVKRPDNLPSPT